MKTGPSWVPQIISRSSFFHIICQVPCCCSSLSRLSPVLHSISNDLIFPCYFAMSTYSISSPSFWVFFSSVMLQKLLPALSTGLQLFLLLFQNLTLLLIRSHQPILETHLVFANYRRIHPLNKELVMQGTCLLVWLIPSFIVGWTSTSQPCRSLLVQGD